MLSLNVRSAVLGCPLAIPDMVRADAGSIINTASVAGLSGDYIQVACGSAKAAIMRLTPYVATQYGHQRKRCNVIAPGAVLTPALVDNFLSETIEGVRGT